MALLYRDTDKDWQQIGDTQPFWGVLTVPEYRNDNLTPESVETFYASGVEHVGWLSALVERHSGQPLRATRALDFGCGVGRLTHAMSAVSDAVIGLDISEGMLNKARARKTPGVQFLSALTDERFDWLHSYIVFQHIPPVRGMAILKDLLGRLIPGGWVTLHFTIGRSPFHRGKTAMSRLRQWFDKRLKPTDRISMFDYDLGKLTNMFYTSGIRQMTLLPTDHGGHLGVFVIGRRDLEGSANG
jgi:2-polyprenyl-3-methyl-5-hydroxy-6-metoxy-1,4-benzoquinol methylase